MPPSTISVVDGDEAAQVRREIEGGARHLFGARVTGERDQLVEHPGGVEAGEPADAFLDPELKGVVDRARMQRVDPDGARRRLPGDRAHEADLRMLGGHVGDRPRGAHGPDDAGGDDDAPARVHARQAVLAGEEGPAHVHGEQRVEHVFRILR